MLSIEERFRKITSCLKIKIKLSYKFKLLKLYRLIIIPNKNLFVLYQNKVDTK